MKIPQWLLDVPLTSSQMLVAGGVLLICAAILLGMRRKSRVVLERSPMTEELMVYLARIATALEGSSASNTEEVSKQFLQRLQAKVSANGEEEKVREMPFSMFGRDILRKE
ncbi:MAG: hypothetical protein WBL63_09970 [Candidatus Acidiferrum sp.]